MRWFHFIVVVLFALATAIFAFQNLQTVTLAFLSFSIAAPSGALRRNHLRAGHGDRRQPVRADSPVDHGIAVDGVRDVPPARLVALAEARGAVPTRKRNP